MSPPEGRGSRLPLTTIVSAVAVGGWAPARGGGRGRRRRWSRRGGGRRRALRRQGDEQRRPELAEDGARDAARVRPGMGAHGLDADLAELRVVAVPAPDAVGEPDQVLELPVAASCEERVQRDAVRAVRLLGQEIALHGARERARRGPVARLDDVVGRERAEEREIGLAAPRNRVVVVAEAVVDGPARRARRPRWRRTLPRTASRRRNGSARAKGTTASASRPWLPGRASAAAATARPTSPKRTAVGRREGAAEGERPDRERRRRDGVAGELVEEDAVPRVEDQRRSREQRGATAEGERDPGPGEHRAREQEGHDDLRAPTADGVERPPDDQRRQRRPEEHRHREHRVPVEHLDVEPQIGAEVATRDGRQGDALGDEDEDRRARRRPDRRAACRYRSPAAATPRRVRVERRALPGFAGQDGSARIIRLRPGAA